MLTCANCGIDLVDHEMRPASVCPECGIAIGAWRRRWPFMKRKRHSTLMKYPRANAFNRIIAGMIDLSLLFAVIMPLYEFVDKQLPLWWSWTAYFIPIGFLMGKDTVGGRSPGKLLTGLVTVNLRTGLPGGFAESVMRNWFFAVIIAPPDLIRFMLGYLLFALVVLTLGFQVLLHRKKRFGDGLAQTQVININDLKTSSR